MAMEIAASAILDFGITPLLRQIKYPFEYRRNVERLVYQIEMLKMMRMRVQDSVEAAERNGELIESDVQNWLRDVDMIILEVERLRGAEDERSKRLFFGSCPSIKSRYQLSRKAKKQAAVVAELQDYGKFDTISHRSTSRWIFVRGHEALESRVSLCKQIMDALKDDNVNMVGVYGMAGVGKTILVKQVAIQAKEHKFFDVVLWASVSRALNIRRIQEEIADMLDLEFDEETVRGRAGLLYERFNQEESILLILDDLWERLDLEEIGIPSKDEHKGCKILLTSRIHHVLLNQRCQMTFEVCPLPAGEAWELFKDAIGDAFENPFMRSTAAEVAKECAGLPLAIVTVARGLRKKSLAEFKKALRELRSSSSTSSTNAALEMSYNQLESEQLKSTFLLYVLMGHDASIRNLLKCGIGLGLFPGAGSLKEAQYTVLSMVLKLRTSSLLSDANVGEQFAVHDAVRDFAVSMAYRYHHVFTTNDEVAVKQLDRDTQKELRQIWLNGNFSELPAELECPQLDLFQIFNDNHHLKIADNFFARMHKLKVLGLSNLSFSSLPLSLSLLKNLQTLCLDRSTLEDFSAIGDLKGLEILSFFQSNIKQLPREIAQLTKLRLLDLSDCVELEMIPPDVFSKLTMLEELYMGNSFHHWDAEGRNNASLAELEQLSYLTNVEIHIQDSQVVPHGRLFERLQSYGVFIGDAWDWDGACIMSRTAKLKLNTNIDHLKDGIRMLLNRTEDLYLFEIEGVKDIVHELDREGFPQLKHLHLHNSSEIQYIISTLETVSSNAFPILESLILYNLASLKKICHGALRIESFAKLRIIEVEHCNKLVNLFSFFVARGLSQLQKIKIAFCMKMEEVVAEESDEFGEQSEVVDVIQFPQLHSLSLQYLPLLKNFYSKVKTLSQTKPKLLITEVGSEEIISEDELRTPLQLFDGKIVFPNLEDLNLYAINIDKLWNDQHPAISVSIQNLQRLVVNQCDSLKYLFSSSLVKILVQLKHLSITSCMSVEEIIATGGLKEEETTSKVFFPKLEFMELSNLPRLTRFCTGSPIECPSLKRMSIGACPEFKTFISNFSCANITVGNEPEEVNSEENNHNALQPLFDEKVIFPSLAEIEISYIDNLEKIWHNNLAAGSFCELRSIRIRGCKKLVNIFPSVLVRSFMRLEVLEIGFCDLLEAIFDLQGLGVEETFPSNAVQLRELSLHSLPRLKHIWNKDPQGKLKFQNLQVVRAFSCGVLKNLFPFSIARILRQLEKLEIVHCGVEQIVAKREDGEEHPYFMFPRLTSLDLTEIRKFRNFYPGKHTWGCPRLKCLAVSGCGNIKYFDLKVLKLQKIQGETDPTVPIQQPLFDEEAISNLEELSLNGEDTATSIIWHCQLPANFYSRLKVIKLKNFYEKSDPIPSGFLQRMCNLETLSVDCSSFETIFLNEGSVDTDEDEDTGRPVDSDEHTKMLCRIKNLVISSVQGITHIWEPEYRLVPVLQNLESLKVQSCNSLVNLAPSTVSFHNLTTLDVYSCHGLCNLITSSTAKSLVQLVKLIIVGCKLVTEILAKQGDERKDEIIFSKLESLELVRLENLTSFCPGNYTFIFPSLKRMVVEECPKMRIFSPGMLSTPKLQGVYWKRDSMNEVCWHGNLNATLQHLYIKMVGCDGIWSLKLSDFPQLKDRWHAQLPFNFFSHLGNLTVNECAFVSAAIPSHLLKFMNNLKNLHVRNCESLEGVFDLEELSAEEGHDRLLPILQELHLIDLPGLRHIWNSDHQGILDFKNLKRLKVHNCSSLRNIFTPSIALGLVHLERIGIRNCALMEEIIVNHGTEAESEVIFHKLKRLALVCLPCLKSFQLGYCAIKLPSLEYVLVQECPQMKTFSQGDVSTLKLRKVVLKEFGDSIYWEGNLNATIQKLFIEMGDEMARSKLPSLPKEPTQEDKNAQHAGSEGQVSENSYVTENPDAIKDFPSVIETAFKTKEYVMKSDPEITQMASRYQESHAASNDKNEALEDLAMQADPIQAQELPAHMGIGSQISLQVQQAPQATEKDEKSVDHVMPTFSILRRNAIPTSLVTPVEQVLVLTSASPASSTSSQELTFTTASQPTAEIPSIPTTETLPAVNFESVFASMEQLINPSPETSSQPASSSNSHAESCKSSSVSFEETYSYSMALIKSLLRKSPVEVSISADRLLLLSSLKNLRNCHFLNSQQLEIIQLYLDNFETLVTSHPFYEQKIDWTKAVNSCIEDDKREIANLKTSYEELTSKIIILSADKETLSKKLQEIEEEEDHIRANMEGLYAQLLRQKGKLETHMKALAEAVRQEREREDRASNIDHYWAKFRSLFA